MGGDRHLQPWLVRGAVLACAVATSGCTLLLLGGVLGDAADEPVATSADAEAGASPIDGGSTPNGGGDEAGASKTGCAGLVPAPKLCEDFDRGVLSGWGSETPDGGITALSTTAFFSPPGSLHVKTTAAPSCSYARLERTLTNVGTKRVEIRMRVRPVSPFVGMVPLAIGFDPNGPKSCFAFVSLEGQGANSSTVLTIQSDGRPDDGQALGGRAPNDAWSELVVVATPATGGGVTFATSLGDEKATPDTQTFAQCGLGTELEIYPGFHCDSGTREAYLDDLRVYAE